MKYLLIILAALIALLLILFLLKILPLLTAKPTIKVNYLAEYNKIIELLEEYGGIGVGVGGMGPCSTVSVKS